jgi:DNA-binding transcriptional MerR regulator
VTERSYLSIGDVLGLLREEFPDITISKIRFLESRGLLVPERTPSGYRKFYDHDVERLRWILRQQREHFLPLKVIKGRLEGAEATSAPESLFDTGDVPPGEIVSPVVEECANPPSGLSDSGEAGAETPVERHLAGVTSSRSMNGTLAGGQHVHGANALHANHPSAGGVRAVEEVGSGAVTPQNPGAPELRAVDRDRASGSLASSRPGVSSESSGPLRAGPLASGDRPAPDAPRAVDAPGGGAPPHGFGAASLSSQPDPRSQPDPGSQPDPRSQPALPSEPTRPREPARPELMGVTLTTNELAHASGLGVEGVKQLEAFGLIEGRMVAGVYCFDEEALAIASLASSFQHFGIEARHLRLFKHAAERQAGLYSQVVLPLLRQRNPAARAKALSDLDRLAELGAALQARFGAAALRDLSSG